MSESAKPSGISRTNIAFFGLRNAGKSSLVNAVTGQDVSIVSEQKGTTTDPVKKTMELLPLGPVVIIDTPGIDDEGELGTLRVERTLQVLRSADIAVLVTVAGTELCAAERDLLTLFSKNKIPYVIAKNKCDLVLQEGGELATQCGTLGKASKGSQNSAHSSAQGDALGKTDTVGEQNFTSRTPAQSATQDDANTIFVSAKTGSNIYELKELIARLRSDGAEKRFVGDLLHKGDLVILVIPLDSAAPKGRLILPQQIALRDILDSGAVPVCCNVQNLTQVLSMLNKMPALVITDSQAFKEVNTALPKNIPLTSFSILMARYKGTLQQQLAGVNALSSLRDGDTVLISEGCTHHRQCEDIGTVKIPAWCKKFTKKNLNFEFTSGGTFPADLKKYALVIHCGACMLNEREMQYRLGECAKNKVPVTNYGTAIAHINGILERSVAPVMQNKEH